MLYKEIITVSPEIHMEHINTLWGLNIEYFNAAHTATCPDDWAVNVWTVDPSSQTAPLTI